MLSEGACETELAPGHRGPAGLSFQPALRNAVSSVPRPEERKLEEQACYANTTLPSFPAIRPRSHRVCGHVTLHGEDAREPTQPVGVRRAWRPSLPADPLPTFPLSSPGPRHPESRGDHDTPGCTGVWKGFFFFKKSGAEGGGSTETAFPTWLSPVAFWPCAGNLSRAPLGRSGLRFQLTPQGPPSVITQSVRRERARGRNLSRCPSRFAV